MDDEMKRELNGVKQAISDLTKMLYARFDQIDGRFARVETTLVDVKGTLHRVVVKVTNMDSDIAEIKRNMATKQDISHQERRLAAFMTEGRHA